MHASLRSIAFSHRQSVRTKQLKVIALGDSLIYGFGDPVGGGWVERLRRQWMSPESNGPIVYNLGVRGDRVIQVTERIEAEFSRRGELRNSLPDVILLSVGVNDSARLGRPNGKSFTEFGLFQQQIDYLLDRAQSLCPIIFVGTIPVDETKMPFLDCLYYNHFDQYRYKEATKQACRRKSIPYLDLFDLWMVRDKTWLTTQLSSDGLHPNSEGYQTMLDDILAWQPIKELTQNRVLVC